MNQSTQICTQQFRDDKRCVEELLVDSKYIVTPESTQTEFEEHLRDYENQICEAYEAKKARKEAAEKPEADADANGKKGGDKERDGSSNGKGKRGEDDRDHDDDDRSRDGSRRGRSRSGDRHRRSRSRSRSRSRDSRSRSRSRSRGRGGGREKSRKKSRALEEEKPPKRGFQEIMDKRTVNLAIIFDALVEKAVVKRKEEVRADVLVCTYRVYAVYVV